MNLKMKEIRTARGLSQKEAAELAGMPVRRFGSYERQERSMSLEDACAIADVLKCTLDELAGRERPGIGYTDHRQTEINSAFVRMDDRARGDLHRIALSLSVDTSERSTDAEAV